MRLAPALALAVALWAVAGCLRLGSDNDLHLVCERRTTSPWHPYAPSELAALTEVRTAGREIEPFERNALFGALADAILTPGARPYDAFDATLQPYYEPVWTLVANGTFAGANVTDRYLTQVELDGDRGRLTYGIDVPSTIAVAAREIAAANLPDLTAGASFVPASWDPALPGCVELTYGQTTAPSSRSRVTVNVDTHAVVLVENAIT